MSFGGEKHVKLDTYISLRKKHKYGHGNDLLIIADESTEKCMGELAVLKYTHTNTQHSVM